LIAQSEWPFIYFPPFLTVRSFLRSLRKLFDIAYERGMRFALPSVAQHVRLSSFVDVDATAVRWWH